MKRDAPDDDENVEHAEHNGGVKRARSSEPADNDDDDLDAPVGGSGPRGGGVRKGYECPYLDTISRQVLPGLQCLRLPELPPYGMQHR